MANTFKSFTKQIKEFAAVITFIISIMGMFSTVVFIILDNRNDERYLQLLEISTKLDPIYVSIESYKEERRLKEIRTLENAIFNITYEIGELARKKPPQTVSSLDLALLGRHKQQLLALQAQAQ